MQKIKEVKVKSNESLLIHALRFSKNFKYSAILKSNEYEDPYGQYELMAAFGAYRIFAADTVVFLKLKEYYEQQPSWLFGHLSYDLKNDLEALSSRYPQKFQFPLLGFFEPAYLLLQKRNSNAVEFWCNQDVAPEPLLNFAKQTKEKATPFPTQTLPKMQARISKQDYLKAVNQLKNEIQLGSIYEINYCQEFYSKVENLQTEALFSQLNNHSPMPFASFYKFDQEAVIGASPERFLNKTGRKLISQPIKGTAKKGKDVLEDEAIKLDLRSSLKEQTENVMIVDLVRNDLSRTAAKGSVKVEELFGVYSFPQVHQLISSISSELNESYHFTDAIKHAFPMGSMTGAPKISAMKLIDQYEKSRREMYSSSIGYIDPNGNFDFNVVIRSLIYSARTNYLSLTVGGAITHLAEPESEYSECLLKAKAIFEL